MIRLAIIFASILLVVYADTVCYEEIGCFSNDYPLGNMPPYPCNFLPQSPDQIGTTFLLNTRDNPLAYDNLTIHDLSSISSSHLNPNLPTKVIVHGYIESGSARWMSDMMKALLKQHYYNVIRVDWSKGAFGRYRTSTANTRIVGAEISLLMNKIRSVYSGTLVADPYSWHIIGHSLGAHIAGYAGEMQNGLGRITGLDPAGPCFSGDDISVRLDPTDAIFVDVIHTDTLVFGIDQPVGHMDFYINGGREQPGCHLLNRIKTIIYAKMGRHEAFQQLVFCNHIRSREYFNESILSSCPFMTGLANSSDYDKYYVPLLYFNNNQEAEMGFYADYYKPLNGTTNELYMGSTLSHYPYCAYQYRVRIFFDNPNSFNDDAFGDIYLTLTGAQGQSQRTKLIGSGTGPYKPGTDADFRLDVGPDVGNLNLARIVLYWEYDYGWEWILFQKHYIYVTRIEVQAMGSHAPYLFCGSSEKITSHKDNREFFPMSECNQ